MNELNIPCSCAIDSFPPTTSIVECAEHGLPQNLEDTEFPGATPKGAVLLVKPKSKEVVAIAPVYSSEQATRVRQRGEELGLTFAEVVTIYSPADLDRVETMEDIKVAAELAHKPGCIFAPAQHPGECYVEPHQSGADQYFKDREANSQEYREALDDARRSHASGEGGSDCIIEGHTCRNAELT